MPPTPEQDHYVVTVFNVPREWFASLRDKAGEAVDELACDSAAAAHAAGEAAKKLFAVLKEAGAVASALGHDTEELARQAAEWTDGCAGPVAGFAAAAAALATSAFGFGILIPADATGIGAVVAAPAQVAALAAAIASAAGVAAALIALVECKQTQLQAAQDKAAQAAKDARQAADDARRDEAIRLLQIKLAAEEEARQREANLKKLEAGRRQLNGDIEKLKQFRQRL
jgi:hypothetical protein